MMTTDVFLIMDAVIETIILLLLNSFSQWLYNISFHYMYFYV